MEFEPKLINYFSNIFNNESDTKIFYNEFISALKASKAIIAGGSVTAIYSPKHYEINDLDIYVNIGNSRQILEYLCNLFTKNIYKKIDLIDKFVQGQNTNGYSDSFLVKNRIYKVIRFAGHNTTRDNIAQVDLMLVHNNHLLTDVVKNFDLTCCQCYYDGEKVHHFHEDITKDGIMKLNDDYLDTFLKGNHFTVNRIKKYTGRGFSLQMKISPESMIISSKNLEYKDTFQRMFQFYIFSKCFTDKIPTIAEVRKLSDTTQRISWDWFYFIKNVKLFKNHRSMIDLIDYKFRILDKKSKYPKIESESYDPEDFVDVGDYEKIGLGDRFIYVVKLIYQIFSNSIPNNHQSFDCRETYTYKAFVKYYRKYF